MQQLPKEDLFGTFFLKRKSSVFKDFLKKDTAKCCGARLNHFLYSCLLASNMIKAKVLNPPGWEIHSCGEILVFSESYVL